MIHNVAEKAIKIVILEEVHRIESVVLRYCTNLGFHLGSLIISKLQQTKYAIKIQNINQKILKYV